MAGGLTTYGAGTGSFAGLACATNSGNCGSIQDILSFASVPATQNFLTLSTGTATTVSFDLTSITSITRTSDQIGGTLMFTADGILHDSRLDDTAARMTFTTQGMGTVSFSGVLLATPVAVAPVAVTPEPSGLLLLGTGLLGMVRIVLRRSKTLA